MLANIVVIAGFTLFAFVVKYVLRNISVDWFRLFPCCFRSPIGLLRFPFSFFFAIFYLVVPRFAYRWICVHNGTSHVTSIVGASIETYQNIWHIYLCACLSTFFRWPRVRVPHQHGNGPHHQTDKGHQKAPVGPYGANDWPVSPVVRGRYKNDLAFPSDYHSIARRRNRRTVMERSAWNLLSLVFTILLAARVVESALDPSLAESFAQVRSYQIHQHFSLCSLHRGLISMVYF